MYILRSGEPGNEATHCVRLIEEIQYVYIMATYVSYVFWLSLFLLFFCVIIINRNLWFRGRGLQHFDQR